MRRAVGGAADLAEAESLDIEELLLRGPGRLPEVVSVADGEEGRLGAGQFGGVHSHADFESESLPRRAKERPLTVEQEFGDSAADLHFRLEPGAGRVREFGEGRGHGGVRSGIDGRCEVS